MKGENRDFLLLVKFDGVDKSDMMEKAAPGIDKAYMELYGNAGARTVFILDLDGAWDLAVRYEGPEESAGWLEEAIRAAAAERGGSARTSTPVVLGDITEQF